MCAVHVTRRQADVMPPFRDLYFYIYRAVLNPAAWLSGADAHGDGGLWVDEKADDGHQLGRKIHHTHSGLRLASGTQSSRVESVRKGSDQTSPLWGATKASVWSDFIQILTYNGIVCLLKVRQ